MREMNLKNGFTLIELIVTVAVLAILATVAVPSFMDLIEGNRVSSQANTLLSATNLARSEAVKLGEDVTLHSNGASFNDGWCVFPASITSTPSDCDDGGIIRNFAAPNALNITASGLTSITFDSRGFRAAPGRSSGEVKIAMDPQACEAGEKKRRVLSISLGGRASLLKFETCD